MLALLFSCAIASSPLTTDRFQPYQASFQDCYDGDTCDFKVSLGLSVYTLQRVRFYGVNAPELRGEEREAGLEVKSFVTRILQMAHTVVLMVPQKRGCRPDYNCDRRGKYGRLLAEVIVDGQSLNRLLLQTGRARSE